jgi:hypothetical protein
MSNAVPSPRADARLTVPPGLRLGTAATLAAWLLLVIVLGSVGAFVTPPREVPFRIAIGVTAPVILFFFAIWLSRAFREFLLTADLRVMTAIQAWRFAGFGFLALYAHAVLPGSFAWPAGLGDIAIGVTAPWILLALLRRPAFAASGAFLVWNALGILDLIVAVGTGAAGSVLATGSPGEISTRPMAQFPLVLIPAYFVPIFLMLHVAALMQARRLRQEPAQEG